MKRVAVTGLGVISPVGNDVPTFWNALCSGTCGIGPITKFDATDYPVKLAAEVRDFDPRQYMEKLDILHSDVYTHFAMAAACQAVADSGIAGTLDAERVGVYIGSGIGGGTLSGLSELITGVHQYALIRKLCQDGDLSQIDLTIGDMSKGKVGTLPPEATAANFAKLAEDATSADKMRGLVNLVLQAIGTMSVLACRTCGTNTVVLTGALTMLPPAHETFELFTQLYGVEYIIPENATFATAIGAALYSMRRDR